MNKSLLICLLAVLLLVSVGCISEPDRQGNAIVYRDMVALEAAGEASPEVLRAKNIAKAKIEAHGQPGTPVLDVAASQDSKDEEAQRVTKAIVESAKPWRKWLGDMWPWIMGAIGGIGSLAGIGWKIYTGNWAGVLHDGMGILSEAVEKFGPKEMKDWIGAQAANSKTAKKMEEFHLISKAKVNGEAKPLTPSITTGGDTI